MPTTEVSAAVEAAMASLVEATRAGRRVMYRVCGGQLRNLLQEAMFDTDHQVTGELVDD